MAAWGPPTISRTKPVVDTPRYGCAARRAFSLIELLLVVVILGIVTAITLPRMSVAMGGGRLRIAARTIAQSGRYARTMAILHQAETELVLDIAAGTASVQAAGGDRAALMEDALGLGLDRPAPPEPDASGIVQVDSSDPAVGGSTTEVLTGNEFAEEIATQYSLEGVKIRFLGYDDVADGAEESGAREEGVVTLRYHSNGTCRPYRVRITSEDGSSAFEVIVDVVGGSRIIAPGDE